MNNWQERVEAADEMTRDAVVGRERVLQRKEVSVVIVADGLEAVCRWAASCEDRYAQRASQGNSLSSHPRLPESKPTRWPVAARQIGQHQHGLAGVQRRACHGGGLGSWDLLGDGGEWEESRERRRAEAAGHGRVVSGQRKRLTIRFLLETDGDGDAANSRRDGCWV